VYSYLSSSLTYKNSKSSWNWLSNNWLANSHFVTGCQMYLLQINRSMPIETYRACCQPRDNAWVVLFYSWWNHRRSDTCIHPRNRQGMFATKASLQFIKQLCSILFYIFCFALEAECFYFAFNWCDRLGLQILFTWFLFYQFHNQIKTKEQSYICAC